MDVDVFWYSQRSVRNTFRGLESTPRSTGFGGQVLPDSDLVYETRTQNLANDLELETDFL